MNRSESKYFYTALCMDEALISLLKEKDLEYITVKEICEKAGVNRSTFYLHYETIADLVNKGKDLEKIVLSRAVQKHIERKVLVYKNKTVIFN